MNRARIARWSLYGAIPVSFITAWITIATNGANL